MAISTPINLEQWILQNRSFLEPPVCNKLIFDGKLKVFIVGGPNNRQDFHVNLGEEIFFMIKGSMVLKVIHQGNMKNVAIKQGEMLILPAKVPHSPQRPVDSIGLVIERERESGEFDSFQFYSQDYSELLLQRWIHIKKIDQDLGPFLLQCQNILQMKLERQKNCDRVKVVDSREKQESKSKSANRVTESSEPLEEGKKSDLLAIPKTRKSKGNIQENSAFKLLKFNCDVNSTTVESLRESRVYFFESGMNFISNHNCEMFFWHLGTGGELRIGDSKISLANNDCVVVDNNRDISLFAMGLTIGASIRFRVGL